MAEEEFRLFQAQVERRAHPPTDQADDIDKARKFDAELRITLCGKNFKLRPTGGLIALLTYCSRGTEQHKSTRETEQALLAAMHELIQSSLTPEAWPYFEEHAMTSKAAIEDIEPCIRQIIEAYTARPYMPGLRLLAGAAADLGELDGVVLMGTGRSVATFTAREVCNLQLARVLQGLDRDTREVVLEDLYLDFSPEAIAMDQVRQMIESKRQRAEEAEREQQHGPGDNGATAAAGDPGDNGNREMEGTAG